MIKTSRKNYQNSQDSRKATTTNQRLPKISNQKISNQRRLKTSNQRTSNQRTLKVSQLLKLANAQKRNF